MLKYNIRGENVEVTDVTRDYVEKKLFKLEKYFTDTSNSTAHVNLKVYSDKSAKVEVTVPMPSLVLRAEETSQDLLSSVDLVTDKLERQIRKYKTKINRQSRGKGIKDIEIRNEISDEESDSNDDEVSMFDVVRTKHVSLKPMSSEEAILQMDMLSHNFFIYEDADTEGTNIVYKRKDGRYGLIEAED
ncbi:ribosome hibernation-promoting factor, HPF/YfiA family [Dellaglioa sp. L3N]